MHKYASCILCAFLKGGLHWLEFFVWMSKAITRLKANQCFYSSAEDSLFSPSLCE